MQITTIGLDIADRYLRRILVGGAVSILRRAKLNPAEISLGHAAAGTATIQGCCRCAR